jgi:hypothetical protein
MSSELFDFVWRLPSLGYQWVDGFIGPEAGKIHGPELSSQARVLIENFGREVRYTPYRPLQKHPALFRTFAALEPTEDSFRSFADGYGNLGFAQMVSVKPPTRQGGPIGVTGEPYDVWRTALGGLKEAVYLWDLFQQAKRDELEQIIRWDRDALGQPLAVYYVPKRDLLTNKKIAPGDSVEIASPRSHQHWLNYMGAQDYFTPAKALLLRWVNVEIGKHVAARLLYDVDKAEPVLRMVPRNLLGCLWLQLAQNISGDKTLRVCAACRKWFEIPARGSRSDKQFCSDKCRTRAYRQRMEKAKQLREQGKKPKQIAEELGVDLATVRQWIS